MDASFGRREFDRVTQQVGDHLLQPFRIGVDAHTVQLKLDRRQRCAGVRERLDRALDDVREIERAAHEPQLAAGDFRDVEQIVDEPFQERGLAPNDLPCASVPVRRDTGLLEHGARGGDRAQRIAELVAQHREKRVARAQRRFRF